MSSPTLAETIDVLRAIVNRWSGDYHCCPDNKHGATHSAGCPLVAGLLFLARIDPGQSGHTISDELGIVGQVFAVLEAQSKAVQPLPDKSGYSCHWFTRRDRDYYCDQGEGHSGPHHNANVRERGTWVERPPDGVWVDSDGIPGHTVTVRDVPACTNCGRVGHLAEDCAAGTVIVDGPGDPCDRCGRVPCTCP